LARSTWTRPADPLRSALGFDRAITTGVNAATPTQWCGMFGASPAISGQQRHHRSCRQLLEPFGYPPGIMTLDHRDRGVVKRRDEADRQVRPNAANDRGMPKRIGYRPRQAGGIDHAIPGPRHLGGGLPGSALLPYPFSDAHLPVAPPLEKDSMGRFPGDRRPQQAGDVSPDADLDQGRRPSLPFEGSGNKQPRLLELNVGDGHAPEL